MKCLPTTHGSMCHGGKGTNAIKTSGASVPLQPPPRCSSCELLLSAVTSTQAAHHPRKLHTSQRGSLVVLDNCASYITQTNICTNQLFMLPVRLLVNSRGRSDLGSTRYLRQRSPSIAALAV